MVAKPARQLGQSAPEPIEKSTSRFPCTESAPEPNYVQRDNLNAVTRRSEQGLPRLAADSERFGGLTGWPWTISLTFNEH